MNLQNKEMGLNTKIPILPMKYRFPLNAKLSIQWEQKQILLHDTQLFVSRSLPLSKKTSILKLFNLNIKEFMITTQKQRVEFKLWERKPTTHKRFS